MSLYWRQFLVYLDAFTWLMNEESEKGRTSNMKNDLRAMVKEPRLVERKKRMVEQARERNKRFKKK